MTVRTNLFELPLLSDNDLIMKETLSSNDLPLKPDQFIGN